MIEIKFTDVETMQPATLRNIKGMFEVLAVYAETLAAPRQPIDPYAESRPLDEPRAATLVIPPVAPVGVPSTAAEKVFSGPTADQIAALTVSPKPPAGAGIDVDTHGLPWDGRIHSSSKAKVADGSWRQKRNLDPDLLSKVVLELKRTMQLPGAVAPTVVPPPPFVQPAVVLAPAPTNITPSVPVPPIPPTVGAVTTASPNNAATTASPNNAVTTASPNSFLTLMKGITAGYANKTITQEMINAAVTRAGVPSLPMLAQRHDLIPGVATELGVAL